MPPAKLNVALIGAGRIGRVHCTALAGNPRAEIVAVADFFVKAAQSCAADFGIKVAVQDWKEVVAMPHVHAVVVCSPSDTHCEIIIAAAAAGKHIFCEKPIDFDLARIDAALAAVASAGVTMQLGFQRRFDADFKRIKAAVDSGEIGDLYMISIISRDPAPPPIDYLKSSGGLFFDMAVHDLDMCRHLGGEVVSVTAAATSFSEEISALGDNTTAVLTLKLASNAIATIQLCRAFPPGYDQRVEVLGSLGSASNANKYSNSATISTASGIKRDLPLNFFMDRYSEAYMAETGEFVDAVLAGKPAPVTGSDGRASVVLAYAAALSLKEGRTVLVSEVAGAEPAARL